MNTRCPACSTGPMEVFYKVEHVPVHSVRLLHSRAEALAFPTGEINLGFCHACGFISNLTFDENLQDYSAEYESTQAYSQTFNAFSHRLANQIIDRYQLREKKIIEIGCGQGEFLSLLCKVGGNTGTGFDPAYDSRRSGASGDEAVSIIPDYYSPKYNSMQADLVVCKMTLEHIHDVGDFVGVVRKSIEDSYETAVFFQVPAVERILEQTAFWDIYYEHCSYFSLGSLARLFRNQLFQPIDLWQDYGDQYLMIDALPVEASTGEILPREKDLTSIHNLVKQFPEKVSQAVEEYRKKIKDAAAQNQKVVLWGSGSKGVAFLTTLGICDEIEFTVDINPNKENTYMAGTGQKVVLPDFMRQYQPDLVILMNPLYRQEVQAELAKHRMYPEILAVE